MSDATPSPFCREPIVLASASAARIAMLRAAGLAITAIPSGLDERAMIAAMAGDQGALPPADVAAVLAEAKAQTVSASHRGRIVIGADQTLDLDGELFVKAESRDELIRNLQRLRGRMHALHSAVAVARDGETLWSLTETAWMTMRMFSPEFLGRYVTAAGPAALASVGGYQIEGPGVQLFDRIDGDWFVILGLPLRPLLTELRRLGVLET
ncbi:septum formation protein [Tepidamorphus gemmatus]|uniref:Nucleoside triphosphate pyrophosphatase n=1 Tax=Tepidamorphus gemmatus TaxID=747076 RepID=A0A4R3ME14_9HYPH|nr:Maf family protein [Tepidamorphus gemmatus]TCT11900.1 septum formation protein [Tepidamorphus gemmatus]